MSSRMYTEDEKAEVKALIDKYGNRIPTHEIVRLSEVFARTPASVNNRIQLQRKALSVLIYHKWTADDKRRIEHHIANSYGTFTELAKEICSEFGVTKEAMLAQISKVDKGEL